MQICNAPGGEGVRDVGDGPVDGDALHGTAERVAQHLLRPGRDVRDEAIHMI